MGRIFHLKDMVRLIGRHLDRAERTSAASTLLRLSGACESPVRFERKGALPPVVTSDRYGDPYVEPSPSDLVHYLDMEVPCRKCPACLRARAAHWRFRAMEEIAASPRTWFTTLTLNNQNLWELKLRACQHSAKNDIVFEQLERRDQARVMLKMLSPELTAFWKRVRKNSQCPIKFLWVAEDKSERERATSGNLHIHALVHEKSPDAHVRKKVLHAAWKLGWSTHELVTDMLPARYLTKYISKDLSIGLRSSHRYGASESLRAVALERDPPKGEEKLTQRKKTPVRGETVVLSLSETEQGVNDDAGKLSGPL